MCFKVTDRMMTTTEKLANTLKNYTNGFAPVVPFDAAKDKLLQLHFTAANKTLTEEILNSTEAFSKYVSDQIKTAGARYGIGGYNEHRTIYKRSELFGSPSPTVSLIEQDGAKAPSRWEGENEVDNLVEEETVGYRYADASVYGLLKEFSLKHRSRPTEAEDVLWKVLRTKKLEDYKFRRQHIIDRFIADFVCLKEKLIIEIDGLIHNLPEHQITDKERTDRLNQLGFTVIRFTNEAVLHDTENVLQQLLFELKKSNQEEHSDLSSPTGGQGAVGLGAPRRLHLGVDIWGPADTPVYAPLPATVHSFAFNSAYGDYGATLILQHEMEGIIFHTLYGHLSLKSIEDKREGQTIENGEWIATFGEPAENGHWPPHLHFQIIIDMKEAKGDYPGVCAFDERESYLQNSPDGDLILNMMQYAKQQ